MWLLLVGVGIAGGIVLCCREERSREIWIGHHWRSRVRTWNSDLRAFVKRGELTLTWVHRIQTWALEEARRRLEAEGILKEPEDKP